MMSYIKLPDLSGLTSEYRKVVSSMLKEEAASFAKNENDIGCMEIFDLSDSAPI